MVGNGMFAEPGDPDSIYPTATEAHPQSMYPGRQNYTPSDPPEDVQLLPGVARSRVPKFEGTAYEQTRELFAHVQTEFKKHIDETAKNAHLYSREGLNRQFDLFGETAAMKEFDAAEERMKAVRTEAEQNMERIYRKLTPNGDSATESRASRYWHRSERLLDSTKDKTAVAMELVKKASDEELGTLLQELPVYLRSVGASTAWLDHEVVNRVPEYGKASERLRRANQAVTVVSSTAALFRRSIQARRPIPSTLGVFNPKYDPDK
ncbi:Uncharacterised protein [Mycobacteroides abscessus subsp. abscessus]|uniref:hypothetical protein n=2 Tax=Mycobacteroides abscessus TaxID=36809 RepID=UPI0009280859|nr:hypothetical protein [Mycobacteroides abscessus]SHQ37443.1 Uncharacterised protein [Mycobacteroides abscessus subsp. abscessus]SHY83524.1 Uncharacterised protein [Mycobacteroides abscessus subsp. abscessus]SHY96954.1 Uncharacterised protein [Mycobacteroides abscessus subsp. abscessus]SIF15101.1 Uncharacterised protein [Mycobacteroides abscessus subsp. abscessus]SIF45084.1 Uncharacterised protein [Mycobacteroides abscessus subsp. abscessus]